MLAAAAELPARVLLTVGRDADIDALGPAPPNLRVEAWVPQADVLGHADLVVSHGGSGTTLGALAAGLPLVVVPLFADQPDNARRVAAVGAGVGGVAGPGPPPEPIRSSVDPAALREASRRPRRPRLRGRGGDRGRDRRSPTGRRARRASELAAEMAALPPADDALALLTDAR